MSNALRINMTQIFGYPLALEFTAWSQGISWINHIGDQRFENQYYEDKGLSLACFLSQPESQDWQQEFPPNVMQALLAFEQQFSRHTFSCLWFVSRSEAAQQLLLSAPILMWLVMEFAKTHQLPAEQVWPLFSMKRTEILALHDLPPTKSALNLVYKYQSHDFNIEDIRVITELCQHFEARLLGRLTSLNRALATWLLEQPSALQYRFIYHLGDTDIRGLRITLRDTHAMGAQLNQQRLTQQLQRCETIEQLYALHDQLVELFNRHQIDTKKNIIYPTCTFDPSETIIPIKTAFELMQEGQEMAHCIASYHERILNGEYFAFKVLAPERATLGLHFVRGQLRVDQLRLKRNAAPTKETEEAVYWWIENQT